eukprot:GILJ01003437.1.p1 GENE.GILJ01003437.1~~GILJ01003437.1.p1  ORF type:complete len:729 (-),score=124.40 GILJ01003437.1:35-2137(-)
MASVHPRRRESPFPMVPVPQALDMVLSHAATLGCEEVPLQDAYGRILAEDVIAREPFPPFRASTMDGYAVIASDGPGQYTIIDTVTAGNVPDFQLEPGQVVVITTGSPLPEGADGIVPVENTETVENEPKQVKILTATVPGRWIRNVGDDIEAGELVIKRGTRLSSAELGLAATVGITALTVYQRPVVAVLSTGDELVDLTSEAIGSGKIIDSNRVMLTAAIRAAGADVLDLGIAKDATGEIDVKLQEALDKADILVTSGGVSMGELDLVKPLLERSGTIHFGRLHMKPGKPTTFATVQDKMVFALPGNPVSSFVCFHLLVVPAIKKLSGMPLSLAQPTVIRVVSTHSLSLDNDRPEYHRARVYFSAKKNQLVAYSTGKQASSRLLSARSVNAFLMLPQSSRDIPHIDKGDMVDAMLFGEIYPPAAEEDEEKDERESLTDRRHTFDATHTHHQAHHHHHKEHHQQLQQRHSYNSVLTDALLRKQDSQQVLVSQQQQQQQSQQQTQTVSQTTDSAAVAASVTGSATVSSGPVIRVGVLTISDRISNGEATDRSGPAICETLSQATNATFQVVKTAVVPDEPADIRNTVLTWVDADKLDIVLTTGGTGFAMRDSTPEAIKPLLDREAPGVVVAVMTASLNITPNAMLSRPVAGFRKQTFILTLPGSPNAVRENLQVVLPVLPHGVRLALGQDDSVHRSHQCH